MLINKRRCLQSPVSVWIQQLVDPTALQGVTLHGGWVDGSCVMCKPPRPNEGLFKGFCLSFGFFVSLCFGTVSPFTAKSVSWCWKLTDVIWRKGPEKRKDFYKVIKFKTELFKCCCFYLFVLVWKWDIPREKRKVPLGSLNRQKPQPRIQNPSTPWILATLFPSWLMPRQKDILFNG